MIKIERQPASIALVLCVSITVFWTLFAGKDLSWDVVNHHFYLPFSVLSGRYSTDLFAAGPQSYQNPLGYFPGYALTVGLNLPAWCVGVILAAIHSINAVVLFVIARTLWQGDDRQYAWPAAATVLAWISPTYLLVAGTTSLDPTTAALVLAGLMFGLGVDRNHRALLVCLSGALVGLAFAIKPSNAVFGLAIGSLLLWRVATGTLRATHLLGYAVGAISAAVLGLGWWSVILWKKFSNPIFPLYNNIFHSPYAPDQAVLAGRFVPQNFWEYISRFWNVARPKAFIWVEPALPDIRPITLGVLILALIVVKAWRLKNAPRDEAANTLIRLRGLDAQLWIFATTSYVLWMATSGNARYAIPLLMVCGVLIGRLAWSLFPPAAAMSLMGTVALLQFAYNVDAGTLRITPAAWDSKSYFSVQAPDRVRNEPYLHMGLGLQSYGSLAPFFHAEGAMMNPIGQMSLPLDGPLGARVRDLLEKWKGRTRVLVRFNPSDNSERAVRLKKTIDSTLYRLSLRVGWRDCLPVFFDGKSTPDEVALHSCAALSQSVPDTTYDAVGSLADGVFRRVERDCPKIFGPPAFVSDYALGRWQRFYPNTDAFLVLSPEDGVFVTHARSGIDRYVGTLDEIRSGKTHFDCKMWSLLAPD